jgi:hypothetical protein
MGDALRPPEHGQGAFELRNRTKLGVPRRGRCSLRRRTAFRFQGTIPVDLLYHRLRRASLIINMPNQRTVDGWRAPMNRSTPPVLATDSDILHIESILRY